MEKRPSNSHPHMPPGSFSHALISRCRVSTLRKGWSPVRNRQPSLSRQAASPSRRLWLCPSSGCGFSSTVKPAASARGAVSTEQTAARCITGSAAASSSVWHNSGLPSSSCSSLLAAPKRREAPAASTTSERFIQRPPGRNRPGGPWHKLCSRPPTGGNASGVRVEPPPPAPPTFRWISG